MLVLVHRGYCWVAELSPHMGQPDPKPQFKDITLIDKETGEPFIFTAKEQEFFARQGFTHVPTRSPERRKLMREKRYKGKPIFNVVCMKCNRVGKITQEPPYPKHILCEHCFDKRWTAYLEKNPELKQQFANPSSESEDNGYTS